MAKKHFKTVSRPSDFPAKCQLDYDPAYPKVTNVYAIFFAIKQAATYGRWTGHCVVDDERIEIDAWGFLEFAHLRW